MPQHQKAIIVRSKGHAELVTDRPLPSLRDEYILIRTVAIALNPIDWRLLDSTPSPNAILGHDYAGTVVAVGKSVSHLFEVGDRVCGLVKGADRTQIENGAFAEYIVAKAAIQLKIPGHVGFEDAATVGVGVITTGLCLFGVDALGMRLPDAFGLSAEEKEEEEAETLLVYGGSSASGLWAIQFAKLAGYKVITTCSPQNFDLVRKSGADAAFDYHDPECARKIRKYTNNSLRIVYDTIATDEATEICSEVIGAAGGKYHSLIPAQLARPDVACSFLNASVAIGEPFEYGPDRMAIPAVPAAFEFASRWAKVVEGLWAQGKLRTSVVEKRDGGLRGVLDGLVDLKEGRVSGRKLVYLVDES